MTQKEITIENKAALARGYRGEIECLKEEMRRWGKETKQTRVKLAQIEEAARELMDETEIEHEGSRSRNLRRFVMNDEDRKELERIAENSAPLLNVAGIDE